MPILTEEQQAKRKHPRWQITVILAALLLPMVGHMVWRLACRRGGIRVGAWQCWVIPEQPPRTHGIHYIHIMSGITDLGITSREADEWYASLFGREFWIYHALEK